MKLGRREFLGAMAAAGQAKGLSHFGLHPFIESNPKAVFIRRTKIQDKADRLGKLREGLKLAREIFVPLDRPGVPVTDRVILKPNWTSISRRRGTVEREWNTGTDPQFYEGMVTGLKELGAANFHFIEANSRETWNIRGFVDINYRLGVAMNETDRSERQLREGDGITWSKVPDPVVYKRIPHFAPVGEPHTWILNMAKWKTHSMCLTQAVKNEQGLVVLPYTRFCPGWRMVTGAPDIMKPDIHPRVEQRVNEFFQRHLKTFPRYQSRVAGEGISPIMQEIWAHKTCDNQSVLPKDGLSMIEGIVALGNTAFSSGTEYLTNLVMFGKDKFRLDLVGLYLGGHEPGNVGFYRIAKERGLTDTFNPWEVPVYEWTDGAAVPRKLSDFERFSLPSVYLALPGEPEFHLCNERFDYDRVKA